MDRHDHRSAPRLLIAATVERTVSGFLLPFADHFRALGWRVDGAASGISKSSECRAHFDELWEIEWSRSPLAGGNLNALHAIRQLALKNEYDLVHVHTPIAGFVTRLGVGPLLRSHRPKLVYTAHGFHFHPQGGTASNALFLGLEKTAGRWTDALVVINHEDERLARQLQLAGRGTVYYMPGIGVDLGYFSRTQVSQAAIEEVRRTIGMERRATMFLMLGAFTREKGQADAVRAFARMRDETAHLVFAGNGPEEQRVQELAARLAAPGNVHFLGYRNDARVLMAACEAMVLPSRREGLPRSVLEAMAMRTAVIGARVRGTDELLGDGGGFLFEAGDVDGLAASMRRIIEDKAAVKAAVDIASRRISRYALPRILALHEQMYGQVLRRAP